MINMRDAGTVQSEPQRQLTPHTAKKDVLRQIASVGLFLILLTSPVTAAQVRVSLKVLDRPVGERVVAKVVVTDAANPASRFEGNSKPPSADLNDHLCFELPAQ